MVAIRDGSSYMQEQKVAVEGILGRRLNRFQFRWVLIERSNSVSNTANPSQYCAHAQQLAFPFQKAQISGFILLCCERAKEVATLCLHLSVKQCEGNKVLPLKNKNQIDATYYFIVLLIGSTCFGHYYAHHQELATIMLITTLVVSFLVCCRLEVRWG